MKIHLGDDTTAYKYRVSVTLMFDLPDYGTVKFNNEPERPVTDEEAARWYIMSKYGGLLLKASKNMRPKDLCGQHEITEYWDLSKTDLSTYTVGLNITGLGIEYDRIDLIRFFLSVFPEFQRIFIEQKYDVQNYDNKGIQLSAIVNI